MGEKKTSSIQDSISVMFILNLLKKGWKLMVMIIITLPFLPVWSWVCGT